MIKFQEYEDTEEHAELEYTTDEDTAEKLTAIVSEIEITLKGTVKARLYLIALAQQEKQQLKDLNKQISQLKKQMSEVQEQISQSKAEEEVLKYQIETSRKKNTYYEQDIVQAK